MLLSPRRRLLLPRPPETGPAELVAPPPPRGGPCPTARARFDREGHPLAVGRGPGIDGELKLPRGDAVSSPVDAPRLGIVPNPPLALVHANGDSVSGDADKAMSPRRRLLLPRPPETGPAELVAPPPPRGGPCPTARARFDREGHPLAVGRGPGIDGELKLPPGPEPHRDRRGGSQQLDLVADLDAHLSVLADGELDLGILGAPPGIGGPVAREQVDQPTVRSRRHPGIEPGRAHPQANCDGVPQLRRPLRPAEPEIALLRCGVGCAQQQQRHGDDYQPYPCPGPMCTSRPDRPVAGRRRPYTHLVGA